MTRRGNFNTFAMLGLSWLCLATPAGCRRAPEAASDPVLAPRQLPARVTLDFEVVGEGPGPLVLLLHGYGSSGDDLVPLARSLHRDPRLGHLRFVLPVGRLAVPHGGRAWWPLRPRAQREAAARGGTRNLAGEHPEELPASREALLALLTDLEARYDVPPSRVAIGGFSQGAMLSVDVALHRDEAPGAVFALSGSVIGESEWRPLLGRLRGVPVLVSHGRRDSVLPFRGGDRLREVLDGAEADVRFVAFDGDHTIPSPVLAALADFLAASLPPDRH